MTSPMAPRGAHRRQSRQVYRRRQMVALGLVLVVLVVIVAVAATALGGGSSSPSSTTRAASPTTTTPKRNPVTIAAVGDTELGNIPTVPSDPASILQPIQSALSAPIVFGNLEGTMTTASSSKCAGSTPGNCYAFAVPPSYAGVMHQAGFTVLNSANNHSHDFGEQGVTDTSAALTSAGIEQAGLPGQIGIVTEGATKVAFVDFAPYSNVNNLLDLASAAQLIAKAKAEAQVVVVYMHAGAEGADGRSCDGSRRDLCGRRSRQPRGLCSRGDQ